MDEVGGSLEQSPMINQAGPLSPRIYISVKVLWNGLIFPMDFERFKYSGFQ